MDWIDRCPVQYLDWVSHILQGDFGVSFRTNRPVLPDLISRFGVTLQLTLVSMIVALVVAIPLGVASAANRGRGSDAVARVLALLGLSIPNFWLGTLLILFVSLVLHWLPPVGFVSLLDNPWLAVQTLILPSLALGTAVAAFIMRLVRSSLLEVLRQDYVRTARAKGLRDQTVLYRHALKNAFIPVLTVIGVQVGYLLGGAVIIESIFSLPGHGPIPARLDQQSRLLDRPGWRAVHRPDLQSGEPLSGPAVWLARPPHPLLTRA